MNSHKAVFLGIAALLTACGAGTSGQSVPTDAQSDAVAPSSAASLPTISPDATHSMASADTSPTEGLNAPDILPPLTPDTLVTVVTNDLVVRSLPEISEASAIHPAYLQDGEELYVIDGPAYADGYAWYHVANLGQEPGDDVAPPDPPPRIGWVASGTPADPWIQPWTGDCPPPEISGIWRQRPLLLLACFGDRELTLEGARGECGYTVPGYVSPYWLNHAWCELMPFDVPSDAFSLGRSTLHFHQDTAQPLVSEDTRSPVRVLGHFDDPVARTCAEEPLEGGEPTSEELVVLLCRARFVATQVTEVDRP